jgi:hypothetical protein
MDCGCPTAFAATSSLCHLVVLAVGIFVGHLVVPVHYLLLQAVQMLALPSAGSRKTRCSSALAGGGPASGTKM